MGCPYYEKIKKHRKPMVQIGCSCIVVRLSQIFWTVKVEYLSKKIWKKKHLFFNYRKVLRIISFNYSTKILKTSKDIPKKYFKIWKFEWNLRIWEEIQDLRSEIWKSKSKISKKLKEKISTILGENLIFCLKYIYILLLYIALC